MKFQPALILLSTFVLVASCAEDEHLWYATRSERIEGDWSLAFFGRNDKGISCELPLEEIQIRIDAWFTSPEQQLAWSSNESSTSGLSDTLLRSPTSGPWTGWTYYLLAEGVVSIDGHSAPMKLAFDLYNPEGQREMGLASVLLDVQPGQEPFTNCGWGNRLSLCLLSSAGNAAGQDPWNSDQLIVSFGEHADGSLRPHVYDRVSNNR
ncbi:MAG: hypothetical protein ACI8TQ_002730 [Planctomycetota bacterium]|jgi:hypothetical protein